MKLTLDKAVRVMRAVTYTVVLISMPIIAFKVVPLIERAVVVLEALDKRIDNAVKELAPLGEESIRKGVETIRSMDGKKIGEDVTDAIRRTLGGSKR